MNTFLDSQRCSISLVKEFLALHSTPVNVVDTLIVLFGLMKSSLRMALLGAIAWTMGFIYQARPPKERWTRGA